MANHLVDRGAHALRIALVVEAGRNGVVILAILHAEVVNFLGVQTRTDNLGNGVETACVNDTTLADAFYLFWSLNQVTGRHQLTLIFPIHHLFVELRKRLTRQAMPSFLLNHCLIF